MTEDVKKYTIDDLVVSKKTCRYSVDIEDTQYECLFINNNSDKLIVSLGGGGREGKSYPVFYRWTYGNFLNKNVLCIDDPMYYNRKFTGVKWYYGTKEKSYLKEMVPIIRKFMDRFNLSAEDLTFLGSSGGGYAAIYLANLFDGSTAMALSPQVDIAHLAPRYNKIFLDELGIDLLADDPHSRNVLQITAQKSLFFLAENILSEVDWNNQFLPFCERQGITPTYGISQHKNIITWVHASNGIDPHSSNPEKYGLVLLDFLASEYRAGKDINSFNNMSLLINEMLNEKYESMLKSHLLTNNIKMMAALISDCYLKSAHGTYLCYDFMNQKIVSSDVSDDDNIARIQMEFLNDYCFLKVLYNGEYMFINNMTTVLQKARNLPYVMNSNGTISIKFRTKYLSSRPNGAVILAPEIKKWEQFVLEKTC